MCRRRLRVTSAGLDMTYRGNRPRTTAALADWHARSGTEQALEPGLPIVDAHHHLFGTSADPQFYRLEDLEQDIASGHNVMGTVWVEAYGCGWRTSGPEEMRSVGEVEAIVRASATPVRSAHGPCQWAAGLVSNVNLMLGDRVAEVLGAHVSAADGRLRGARHHAMHDDGTVGKFVHGSRPHLLADAEFRRGVACLGRFGLSFDALVYHTQLSEVAELADAVPDVPIVLNHVGQVIGVAEYASRRSAVFSGWQSAIRALAARQNVCVKVGGMGMPMFGFGLESGEHPAGSGTLVHAWQPYIDTCIDAFGPQRCIFESNFPVDKQSCGYAELWNAFKLATHSLSHDERRSLFYRTACRTYRLPQLETACDHAWHAWSHPARPAN